MSEVEEFLADSTSEALADRIELRDAVCAYLLAEQAKGVQLKKVLKSVEAIIERAMARTGEIDGHKELAQQLIDWCVALDRTVDLKIV